MLQRALDATGQNLGATCSSSETDAALGNGGLGRLAACFLDSFAELGLPSFGYGLRYRYGMFAQRIQDGRQVEVPDDWLKHGNAWDMARPDVAYSVGFGGRVVRRRRRRGAGYRPSACRREAFDFIVPAHHGERVSTLAPVAGDRRAADRFRRLLSRRPRPARPSHLVEADSLNWVLYPDDSSPAGRELRLKQEAFLVSASLQDMLARHLREHGSLHELRPAQRHPSERHPSGAGAGRVDAAADRRARPALERGLERSPARRCPTPTTR